jgi:hypothetical protein
MICELKNKLVFLRSHFRDVAQSGLEYASGGRGVGSSNLLIPTEDKKRLSQKIDSLFFFAFNFL